MSTPQIITITENATEHLVALMGNAPGGSKGLVMGVKAQGCSGMKYYIDYATEKTEATDIVKVGDVDLYIDPVSVMYVLGTQIDYKESDLERGFVFNNPNESSRCGCGESFHVE